MPINTYIGIITGSIARTYIPYLLALKKNPYMTWDNNYLKPAIAGLIISLISAMLILNYAPLNIGFIGGFTLAYTLHSLSRDVQKSVGA